MEVSGEIDCNGIMKVAIELDAIFIPEYLKNEDQFIEDLKERFTNPATILDVHDFIDKLVIGV